MIEKKESFQYSSTLWFNRWYALVFAVLFFFLVLLSFLPPILMKLGISLPAVILYRLFKFLCHQLPYRSFFLFGEQLYYPLASAGITQVPLTFESALTHFSLSFDQAVSFYGSEQMGYKVALCQRDLAIYIGFGLFCLAFFLSRNRIKRVHWALWLALGIIPIGLDGGSQLITRWLPFLGTVRESMPLFRLLTGALFGWMTGWYILPFLDKNLSMDDQHA